jgi:hypothetical protein
MLWTAAPALAACLPARTYDYSGYVMHAAIARAPRS